MSRLPLPPARSVPWSLKAFSTAQTSLSYDGYGRMVAQIDHELLRGITPSMLEWWFRNIGGEMTIGGRQLNKYLAWHPTDHILWELVQKAPDGSVGVGSRFRIVEIFNGNPDHYVDIVDTVQRLDETGLTLVNRVMGIEFSRLNHDFIATEGGTLYRSTLTVGTVFPGLKGLLNPLMHRYVMSEEKARDWLRHNVEEVGAFEHLLPLVYPGSPSRA